MITGVSISETFKHMSSYQGEVEGIWNDAAYNRRSFKEQSYIGKMYVPNQAKFFAINKTIEHKKYCSM